MAVHYNSTLKNDAFERHVEGKWIGDLCEPSLSIAVSDGDVKIFNSNGEEVMVPNTANYRSKDITMKVESYELVFLPAIKKVIFNAPATIVFWNDGKKTIVKASKDEEFSEEVGLCEAIAKRYFGSRSALLNAVKNAKRPSEGKMDE